MRSTSHPVAVWPAAILDDSKGRDPKPVMVAWTQSQVEVEWADHLCSSALTQGPHK